MSSDVNKNDKYATFVLSVDDLDWTRHWLGDRRCDIIIVSIAKSSNLNPRFRIIALESKGLSETDPIELSTEVQPFKKGTRQVTETLDELWELANPDGNQELVEDLRYASFVEQLASVALSKIDASSSESKEIMRNISKFSLREINKEDIDVVGGVICTQYSGAVKGQTVIEKRGNWDLILARVGSDEIHDLLRSNRKLKKEILVPLREEIKQAEQEERKKVSTSGQSPKTQKKNHGVTTRDNSALNEPTNAESDETTQPADKKGAGVAEERSRIATNLYKSCRQRGFPVEEPVAESIEVGPTLISIPMVLESGASINPIESSLEDLSREVGVKSISVENDPERDYHIRFLVARKSREYIELPEVSPKLSGPDRKSYFGLHIGVGLKREGYKSFLSEWPHMLVGGSTGSGKTTFLKSLLIQLKRIPPKKVNMVIIDGKNEVDYLNIIEQNSKHLHSKFPKVLLGSENALDVLEWLVEEEIQNRKKKLRSVVREKSNSSDAKSMFIETVNSSEPTPFQPLVVVIDEFSELMLRGGQEASQFEDFVQSVAQAGRSTLVHLIMATQRPEASIVKGSIKANLNTRAAFRVPTHHDSMTILGGKGADELLGNGDMIFRQGGENIRLQGYNV